jgi:hypothetical protein
MLTCFAATWIGLGAVMVAVGVPYVIARYRMR